MNPIEDDAVVLTAANRVPDDRRMQFLPRLFGRDMLLGETLVYRWMEELAPDYRGGFWVFYDLSNGGHYMAPDLDRETLRIQCSGNLFDGSMSTDAAGVVATLLALNSLVWKTREEQLKAMFDRLRDYAGDHPEGPAIFSAID